MSTPVPTNNFDLVILIGPGVIIALAAVAIYWFRSIRRDRGDK